MTIVIPEGIPTIVFDYFHQGEIPTFVLCNPNKEQLYALGGISERFYSTKFNSFSELSFRADEYVDGTYMEYYDYLTYRRLIYVDTIGYFMINEVTQTTDGIVKYKEIKAQSLEVELSSKRLVVFQSGSTVMVSGSPVPPPNPVKLDDLLLDLEDEWIPNWTHATVPTGISSKYRSFDVADTTVYDFLMTEVEDAYGCVFDFDTVNQIINIYDPNISILTTDIYISHNNVIKELSTDEVVDELATCLNVHGGGGMDIRWVNPLGNNNIYDLSYFETTEWMTQALIDKIDTWESKIESASPIYSASAQVLIEWYDYISASTAIYQNKSASMTYLLEARKVALEMPGDTGATEVAYWTARIDILQVELDTINNKITTGCTVVVYTTGSMRDLSDTLSFEETFTSSEISQLQPFIVESSYVNANIILTDSMSASNVIIYSEQLYNSASAVLDKISHPKYTFEVDSVNFMQIEEFQMFRDQLCLGAVVTIEVRDGEDIEAILLGMDINFDDPTDFGLTFGNRLRMDDESLKFTDLMGKAIIAGNANRAYSQQWGNWSNNYKNNITNFVSSPINGATNTIINSGSKAEITIAPDGIRARRKESIAESYEGTGYSGSQIYVTANCIAVTMDNWKTYSKIVGGTINYYGLIAHLDDLLDVDATNPDDGDTIIYDSTSGSWIHGPGGEDSCFVCDDTNTYGGENALISHTTGVHDTAIGYNSLTLTTTGNDNTAFGYRTLSQNINGEGNVAVGAESLYNNNGKENIGIGVKALYSNVTGGCNVAIGTRAMSGATDGNDSVAIGRGALYNNRASYNIGIGYHSLYYNTTGFKNVAMGYNALSTLTIGEQNVAIGWEALAHATNSEGNTAIGGSALHKTTYGDFNTAIGIGAMEENIQGYSNVAVGDYALRNNVSGNTNVAIGESAMVDNIESHDNVAIGGGALSTIIQYSDFNIAIGEHTMAYMEEGNGNIGIGEHSLYYNAGDNNIAIGEQTMGNSHTGSYNIAIGMRVMNLSNNIHNNIGIGYQALYNNLAHYNIAIGGSAMEFNTTGQYNTAVGMRASKYNQTGESNVAIGWDALRNNLTSWNTAVGFATLTSNVAGIENTAVGAGALISNLASWNTAIGAWALNLNSSGSNNIAIGAYALEYNSSGADNVAVGFHSMDANITGHHNTAVGTNALFSNLASYNTAIGAEALNVSTSGSKNTAIGAYTLAFNETGGYNVAVGWLALYNNTNGNSNTATGNLSLYYNTDGELNSAVGEQALYYNRTGQMNTAVGQTSMHDNECGDENVAIGMGALERMNANCGIILAFSNYGGTVPGTVRVTTESEHELPSGATTLINIKGTTNYNNSGYTVTRIDATSFYFTHAWSGDDATGHWYHGHSGYMNTAIGAESGYNTGSGAYNIFVGAKADSTVNTDNSIAIGHEAYVTKSNQIMFGNGDITETVLNGHVILANTDWDDLRVPITSVKLAGVKDPGFAVFKTNGAGSTGVYTYWFDKDTEEEVFFSCQMPHQWKEGTDIHPHVHWIPKTNGTTSASRVCWGLEYTWSNITGSFGNTSIIYNNIPIDYSGSPIADNHYLTELPDITASGKTFSSMLICRLFRDATSSGSSDSYGYDAGLLEFDFHYEIDSFGSKDEFVKQ